MQGFARTRISARRTSHPPRHQSRQHSSHYRWHLQTRYFFPFSLHSNLFLADFGVAAQLTSTMPKRRTVIGSPYWMAPEVVASESEYNEKADIWSLAITAMELALGDPPNSDVPPMRAIFVIHTRPTPLLPNPERWSKDFHNFLAGLFELIWLLQLIVDAQFALSRILSSGRLQVSCSNM